MTGKTISPESSASQIYNLEGVPSYDADDGEYDIEEDFVDNDADTIDHHGHEQEQGNGSEDSTRKPPLEVDDSERFKSMWSVRFLIICMNIKALLHSMFFHTHLLLSYKTNTRMNEAI